MPSEASRPLLLPQNRKLRHLQGIYLRNLTLTRPRGQTIDDTALNTTSQKREPQLHHAQSSDELRPTQKGRRRSSNWGAASPVSRQKKLEDVIDARMADTFFTLHVAGRDSDEPVYISEVMEKAMNPTFRFFDLSEMGPAISRLDTITVRIWVKRVDFVPLIEEEVNLQSLQFIGRLENHPFPPNCILFQLVDGIYTIELASKPPKPKPAPVAPTSSYSALMRLSNLDESIQDALATREEIASQINAILKDMPVDESPQAREEAALASRYVASEKKLLKQSIRRRAELKASIAARRKAIQSGKEAQERVMDDINNAQEKLANCKALLSTTTTEIHQQRRRICEELLAIFPIEPTSSPLLFTICSLALPNSHFDDADEDTVSAALGHVARVVDMLQYYLSIPLPYPITAYGSRSIIQDYISKLQDNQRTFPLYNKGTLRFRFEYGVFLLNKDIECLAESQGLKVLDIRQTLPNLKYLLYVCSAGTSELPARKAGGVKGLLMVGGGRGSDGASVLSRSGSADSNAGGVIGEQVRRALENEGKEGKSSNGNGVFSLRTSGLRENVIK
ncbi:UV radiation resistance-associated protein [Lachnellula subtilissima]|uniref:Autophagy-related protein 14 n=1 Tax=Lachnellula subtilissima TaxID=602034 RepID=A0A8H8UFZ8_9HELO|nr:UV radiation resistance-associated protein [Lachnellula subtilissima]